MKSASTYAGWLCRRVDVLRRASICFVGETEEVKKCMVKGLESEKVFKTFYGEIKHKGKKKATYLVLDHGQL